MADKCHLCLLELIFLSSLLTGTSGVEDVHVFISSGENVHLSCNNALPGCKSTTWIYNNKHSATVLLIHLGIKSKDTERHERLSLGSDCSLNIKNITKEDYGSYSCQQYCVICVLFCVSVSSSSSQTEISPGSSVSLSCQLYSYTGVSCDDWVRSEGFELFWVNQAGVKLTISDSRYQISAPGHCISTLTTTLLNEDDNREWRCQVTHRNQVKTSATYTAYIVKKPAQDKTTTAVTPVRITESTPMAVITSKQEIVFVIAIAVTASVALLLALILCLILKKRTGVRRATDDSVVRCDDEVTYASIRRAEAGAQENCNQLYASVNKNHHKSDK
ncbi:uncharacterized protein [Garra rufa]|uniref:uncharacterized protein n=1 Tax=Garra rufa TaxID=137080 RepID=UPI003CCE7C60